MTICSQIVSNMLCFVQWVRFAKTALNYVRRRASTIHPSHSPVMLWEADACLCTDLLHCHTCSSGAELPYGTLATLPGQQKTCVSQTKGYNGAVCLCSAINPLHHLIQSLPCNISLLLQYRDYKPHQLSTVSG